MSDAMRPLRLHVLSDLHFGVVLAWFRLAPNADVMVVAGDCREGVYASIEDNRRVIPLGVGSGGVGRAWTATTWRRIMWAMDFAVAILALGCIGYVLWLWSIARRARRNANHGQSAALLGAAAIAAGDTGGQGGVVDAGACGMDGGGGGHC